MYIISSYTHHNIIVARDGNFKHKSPSSPIVIIFYYIKLKSRLSVRPSVRPECHAGISPVSASIETGLARNESSAFWDLKVYFYKSKRLTIHPHECAKGTGVSQSMWSVVRVPLNRFFYFS